MLTWSGPATDPNRRLIEWRDPVQSADLALPHWTFTYDDAAPDGFGANDIKTKTSPDGQVTEYTYYPLPADGAPDGRAGNVLFADRKSGGLSVERLHYIYPSKRPNSAPMEAEAPGSWVIVEHIDPLTGLESATAPQMRYDFMADGRLVRTTAICNEADGETCPMMPLSATHPTPERITEIIEEIKYDTHDLPSVTTRWARGTNPLITDWESYFS